MIIGGHQRYLAYKELNIKWIDVMVPHRHLDDREVEELSIRLNRHAGDWDYDVLANEFEVEDLLNWGFDSKELGMPSIDEMLEDAKPEKQRKITFTATFETSEALEQVEDDLVALIDRVGGSYKTKS